jgi:hypothetical protein
MKKINTLSMAPFVQVRELSKNEIIIGQIRNIVQVQFGRAVTLELDGQSFLLPLTTLLEKINWEEYMGQWLVLKPSWGKSKAGRRYFAPMVWFCEDTNEVQQVMKQLGGYRPWRPD